MTTTTDEPRRGRGQPTLLTDELADAIITRVRSGSHVEIVCRTLGVNRQRFYEWKARGKAERDRLNQPGARAKAGEARYVRFVDGIEQAEAEAELAVVAHWRTHFAKNPTACERFLARRFPERWGDRIELSGPDRGPIEVVDASAELRDKLHRARKRLVERATGDTVSEPGEVPPEP
jgi:hypothetical protein